jgi:hypothetical protein
LEKPEKPGHRKTGKTGTDLFNLLPALLVLCVMFYWQFRVYKGRAIRMENRDRFI